MGGGGCHYSGMQLNGSVAVVTGGASGLGEATARHLHSRGVTVVIFDRDADRGQAIADELGKEALFVAGSVLSEEDTAAAVEAAAELGPLTILVACAGGGVGGGGRTVGRDGAPHPLEPFTKTVELNLVGSFNSLRLAAAQMAKNEPNQDGERGVVICTASIAGYEGQIGQIAYSAAKAGIIGMTLSAARDLAAIGVRVNSIAPGTFLTPAWGQVSKELKETLEAKVPFPRRFGDPSEFAQLAEHMVTNGYLNGQVIRLDGAIRFDPK
jgi:NAD(P)-dependent dehydrogenase (short-subunit alcohol dehydrogenase family)